MDGDIGEQGDLCSLFVLSKHWEASEVSWNNATKDVEWEDLDLNTRYYDPATEDTVEFPGGGDHEKECIAAVQMVMKFEKWEDFIITPELKYYLKNPSEFNGLYLKAHFENSGRLYASSEYEEIDKRPKLTFKYKSTGINQHTPVIHGQNGVKIAISPEAAHVFVSRDGSYSLTIMDLRGKRVRSITGDSKGRVSIPRSTLRPGVHIFTLSQKNTFVKKVCIY